MAELSSDQWEAVQKMKNGCILCGDVGSGKSRTALAYYIFRECKGAVPLIVDGVKMDRYRKMSSPRDLYIITTAKKRDSKEWLEECGGFALNQDMRNNPFRVNVVVDSWNNIQKYKDVCGEFFILDEQRVIGSGTWVKTFLNISRKNHWILLTATPGDTWSDYIPVFVANRFYRNKTEFQTKHCVFSRFAKYPKIDRYVGLKELERNRDAILVKLRDRRHTVRHNYDIWVDYDRELYKTVMRDRWDPYDQCPIEETGKLGYLLRKVVNDHPSRICRVDDLSSQHPRMVIFYNYNYELGTLIGFCEHTKIEYAQWNGQKHEELPTGENWVYLVQYSAGCEGWNCITTDTIIFYSQNYSYRMLEQASGRIDRMNSPYKDLYYYHFRSRSSIDLAIWKCLQEKRNFNENSFLKQKGMK